MRHWEGYTHTALVLDEKEYTAFLELYGKKHPEEQGQLEGCELETGCEAWFKSAKGIGATFAMEAIGYGYEGMRLTPYRADGAMNTTYIDGRPNRNFQSYALQGPLYMLAAERQLDCADAFQEKPYESYEELVQEFKDKLEGYLPADFDWDKHIGSFSYAMYA